MKCTKCGEDYPSEYHFKAEGVCVECYQKLSPQDQAALDQQPKTKQPPGLLSGVRSLRRLAVLFNVLAVLTFLGSFVGLALTLGRGFSERPVAFLMLIIWFLSGVVSFVVFAGLAATVQLLVKVAMRLDAMQKDWKPSEPS